MPNSAGMILTLTTCVGVGSQALQFVVTSTPKNELVHISLKINSRIVPLTPHVQLLPTTTEMIRVHHFVAVSN